MKIEEKQLQLGEKIAKIAIFGGMFMYLLGIIFSAGTTSFGLFRFIAAIFGLIAIGAFSLKLFLNKGESIVKHFIIFGGIGYIFFISLAYVINGSNYSSTITVMVLSFLVLAGLVYESVEKNLEKYDKFIPGLIVFFYGFFIGLSFSRTFGSWSFIFPIIAVILMALGVAIYIAVYYFQGMKSSE